MAGQEDIVKEGQTSAGDGFRLFRAPLSGAEDHAASGRCCGCGQRGGDIFALSAGDALIVRCPACKSATGLDAGARAAAPCECCGEEAPFPDVPEGPVAVCAACLRARGAAAIAHHTSSGPLLPEHVLDGDMRDLPGLECGGDTLEEGLGPGLSRDAMWDLLRTPRFEGEGPENPWPVCCGEPMIYRGEGFVCGWCGGVAATARGAAGAVA